MYDTRFGNGKKLAESLKNQFPSDHEVEIGDVKEIAPELIANEHPDALILGGAIRMFRGAPKSKKWLKKLDKTLKNDNHKIKYAGAFLTHGLPTDKMQGFGRRYLRKLEKSSMIEKVYPELLTTRVKTQQGPIYEEEMEKSDNFIKDFMNWMKEST
ncbi:MAG: hypothetical protein P8Y70_05415 [Candidatus Lokiarchaeota archaeon]